MSTKQTVLYLPYNPVAPPQRVYVLRNVRDGFLGTSDPEEIKEGRFDFFPYFYPYSCCLPDTEESRALAEEIARLQARLQELRQEWAKMAQKSWRANYRKRSEAK